MAKQSITKNYIFNTAYQILNLITPLITAPYISRILGADGVGTYSYTNSVVAFFVLFSALGTTVYGQRAIAQSREHRELCSKTFWEIEILSLIVTAICTIIWVLLSLSSSEYGLYFIILTMEILAKGFDISWFYGGLEQFKHIVLRNVVVKIISIVLLFLLVNTENDLWIYIAIVSAGKLGANISMWIGLNKFVDTVAFKKLNIKSHLKETFAYFVPTAAASVYTYLDKVMLETFTDSTVENGYYEQAHKIISMAHSIVISLNTVMSSRMSYLFAYNDKKQIKDKLEKAVAFIMTLSVPLVFGVSAIAHNFVPWFFGDGFEKVSILLIMMSPLILILSFHNFLSAQYLVPSGQRVRSTKGVFIGAGVNFVLNLILIPKFQSVGAVFATLIAETSICIVYLWMSKEYVSPRLLFKYLPKQLIAAVIMAVIALLIGKDRNGNILVTILQVVAGAVIYFGMLLIMKENFTCSMSNTVIAKFKNKSKSLKQNGDKV